MTKMIKQMSPESQQSSGAEGAFRKSRVVLVSTLLALLFPARFITQDTAPSEPTEPEVNWIFPLGSKQGSHWQAEVEGRLLDGVYAVWFPDQGLKGRIREIRHLPVEEEKAEGSEVGTKKKLRTQRVSLDLETDPTVRPGIHSLRLVSKRGVSNSLNLLISPEPVISESDRAHQVPSEAQTVKHPVTINGRIARTGEVDYYSLRVAAQEELSFELFTPAETFRPTLRLYEEKGSWLRGDKPSQLEFSDQGGYGASRAMRRRHRFNRAGRYLIAVGSIYGKSDSSFIYQLRIVSTQRSPAGREWPGSEGQTKWSERQYVRKLTPLRLQQLWSRTIKEPGNSPPAEVVEEALGQPQGKIPRQGTSDHNSDTTSAAPTVFEEKEPNGRRDRAAEVVLPALISGRIEAPGDVDLFRFRLPSSQFLVFEVETPYVPPPAFSPSIKVLDSEGHELFNNKHRKIALSRQDPIFLVELLKLHLPDRGSCGVGALSFFESLEAKMVAEFAVAGQYYLQIGDLTSQKGHPDHAYRVVVRPRIPHVGELELEGDRINLKRGQVRKLKVTTGLEEGYAGDVALSIEGLPAGVVPLTGMEVEPQNPIGPTTESQQSFLGFNEKAIILLRADREAPLTEIPVLVKVWARPAVKNALGSKLLVGEVPLMVIGAQEVPQES